MPGNASVICDAQGNMVAGYAGTNLAATQPALATAGSDYGTPAKAQVPKVDAQGSQYAVPASASGIPMPLNVGAYTATPANAVGQISLAWAPSPTVPGAGTWVPFQVDPTGAGVVRQALAATFEVNGSVGTGTAANRSMVSLVNTGNMVHRIMGLYAMCPPQQVTSGGLLATSTTYTQVLMGVYRITGHTGGAVANITSHDPADTIDPGLTARFGATVQGETPAALMVWDAAYNGTFNAAVRQDQNVKLIAIPPGTGIHVKLPVAPGGNVTFVMRLVTSQNVA